MLKTVRTMAIMIGIFSIMVLGVLVMLIQDRETMKKFSQTTFPQERITAASTIFRMYTLPGDVQIQARCADEKGNYINITEIAFSQHGFRMGRMDKPSQVIRYPALDMDETNLKTDIVTMITKTKSTNPTEFDCIMIRSEDVPVHYKDYFEGVLLKEGTLPCSQTGIFEGSEVAKFRLLYHDGTVDYPFDGAALVRGFEHACFPLSPEVI